MPGRNQKIDRIHSLFVGLTLLACNVIITSFTEASAQSPNATMPSNAIPPPAQRFGYFIRTFSEVFAAENIDLYKTKKPGFSWYPADFFSVNVDTHKLRVEHDQSITLMGQAGTANGQLATAVPVHERGRKIRGMSFGGGGYFEAIIRFDPRSVQESNWQGWPSFWALAAEGIYGKGTTFQDHWSGQPPEYRHNIEVDILEFNQSHKDFSQYYGIALHDWYGIYDTTCKALCGIQNRIPPVKVPVDTDFTKYHAFGILWVPAELHRKGFVEFYFDGVAVGKTTEWSLWSDSFTPPPQGTSVYSYLDRQHLVLIFGSGENRPMNIKCLNVWQLNKDSNISE